MENENTCHCCKKKDRSDKERKDLMNRLSRIEGQIRGIRGMVEKDCYCPDIITQVAAANAALNSFNKALLAEHIRTCVADGIRNGEDEKIDELVTMLQKLMKSLRYISDVSLKLRYISDVSPKLRCFFEASPMGRKI